MSAVLSPWRVFRDNYRRRLSWKLTVAHLTVVMISQVIYLAGVLVLLALFGPFWRTPSLPAYSREMAEETRLLAGLLADPLAHQTPEQLSALLASLPSQKPTGLGAFDGVLSPTDALVIAAPDGTIRASSSSAVPIGQPIAAIEPPAWGRTLASALRGERNIDPDSPLADRDTAVRVLVTAYPIADAQGRVIGAFGLRSAQVPQGVSYNPVMVLASLSALALGQLLITAILASITSTGAGFLLARAFGRRLAPLEAAAEAIARGDLSVRVKVADPDEIGRLGERFNLLTARLDEIERARRAFVSNISHELRTPLAIIRGHVEAQLAGSNTAPARDSLETIDREARALGRLIDDLFTLTRIEEAALPLQPALVAVQEIAAAAVAGIRPLASAHGHVAVHSVVPADLPPALADRTRLGQIINNLLYNALRHTPDGGVIVVEGLALAGDTAIEIAVTDTGTGIAPADLPHIFDRFYRGEGGTGGQGSSGLGLTIVKQLVEAQGGTVRAASAPGEGTSIRFTLPRAG